MSKLIVVAVDDEVSILELYKKALGSFCDFRTYLYPQELIAELKNNSNFKPSLLMTDYRMPEMNGIELVQRVREMGHDLTSIMISGFLDKQNVMAAANMGRLYLLEKPVSRTDIISTVKLQLLQEELKVLRAKTESTIRLTEELSDVFRSMCLGEMQTLKGKKLICDKDPLLQQIYNLDRHIEDLKSQLATQEGEIELLQKIKSVA